MTILEAVAAQVGCTRKEAKEFVSNFVAAVFTTLKSDGRIRVPGLGSFRVKRTPARKAYHGMNRFTNKEQDFPAKPAQNKLRFGAGKEAKEQISKFKVV